MFTNRKMTLGKQGAILAKQPSSREGNCKSGSSLEVKLCSCEAWPQGQAGESVTWRAGQRDGEDFAEADGLTSSFGTVKF